jgi:hypothetical protein
MRLNGRNPRKRVMGVDWKSKFTFGSIAQETGVDKSDNLGSSGSVVPAVIGKHELLTPSIVHLFDRGFLQL